MIIVDMSSLVVIMAGGLGKRMNSEVPKVLHELVGIPMLVRVIKTARLLNPVKILVVVGKYRDLIINTCQQYTHIDDLAFVLQPTALGTGDAVKTCMQYFEQYPNAITYILSGDVPLISYETLNKLHNCDVNLITQHIDNPSGYGRIVKHGDKLSIVEEKDATPEEKQINEVNAGIYAIHSKYLIKYLPLIQNNNKAGEYYLTQIIELLNNDNISISTYVIPNDRSYEVAGVNNPEELAALANHLK